MVVMGHYLFLFGSYTHPEGLVAYDLRTGHLEAFTLSYIAARHTAAVELNWKVYIIGGKTTLVVRA